MIALYPHPVFEKLKNLACNMALSYHACGSRVTCNPPPTDTDADFIFICYSKESYAALIDLIEEEGFSQSVEADEYDPEESQFESWTLGELNFIITKSAVFFARHRAATHICTTLNLMDKGERIMVFRAMLYNETYDPKKYKPKPRAKVEDEDNTPQPLKATEESNG